ncbi:MAG: transcriptional regulator [Euryarchaeota archaeon]|nr:transcriptional regulator [Euryarchaeota archaeon]|tara:strand:+ start:47140 stop:48141 length:1002 start_codon:yes stop_codon:yes gene_type:complete
MADGIRLVGNIEWWQSDDGSWYFRQSGTEQWTVDSSGTGPQIAAIEGSMVDPGELFTVIESATATDGTKVEIVEYSELLGSSDVRTSEALYYTTRAGSKLKMVRIQLNNSKVRVEPGALYFMKGQLEMKVSTGGGLFKGMKRKMLSGETFFVNEIHGSGEIYLEPSFGHFFLQNIMGPGRGIICDKGMFFAGAGQLNISAKMQGTISSTLFGGEGLFQSHITGSGIAVLYSPVPKQEIVKYTLNGDKLFVDGNFALLRHESITFKVEKSSKRLIGSLVSGEGLLQTFSGQGEVWIAPTQGVYEKLTSSRGMASFADNPTSSGTKVRSGLRRRK